MKEARGFIGPNHTWPAKRECAKRLRQEATRAERRAWGLLRGYRGLGFCFRRQQVIDGFIADFFCAKLRLVIELDGGIHDDQSVREQDLARDTHLGQLGLAVVRIPNDALSAERIETILHQRIASLGSPLPRQGEGDRG
jgi:very-short-patch-repair endonuclease